MSDTEHEQDANLDTGAQPNEEPQPNEDSPFQAPEPIEGDDDDLSEGGASEPAAQPTQDDGNDHVTPEELEARAKRTETSFKTYTRAVERNYAEDFEYLTPCILCPDQHKGFIDVRAAGYVPQEIQEAVRMYFGIAREQDYAQSPHLIRCDACDGKGKVSTGSTVPEHVTVICDGCGGRGYRDTRESVEQNGHVETGPQVYGHEPIATQAYDEVDEWDEPRILPDGRENPNFGKMPNRKILVEPWGVTAGLNAMSPTP